MFELETNFWLLLCYIKFMIEEKKISFNESTDKSKNSAYLQVEGEGKMKVKVKLMNIMPFLRSKIS